MLPLSTAAHMQDSRLKSTMQHQTNFGKIWQMGMAAVHVCEGYGTHPRVSSLRRMVSARCWSLRLASRNLLVAAAWMTCIQLYDLIRFDLIEFGSI